MTAYRSVVIKSPCRPGCLTQSVTYARTGPSTVAKPVLSQV